MNPIWSNEHRESPANGLDIPEVASQPDTPSRSEATAWRRRSVMHSEYIWLNGELVPFDQATTHFLSPTLHYGPGVFEGIRCYNTDRGPAVFRLQEHLERFVRSVQTLGIRDFTYDVEALRDGVCRTVLVNGFVDCYVRPMLYFTGSLSLNLDDYQAVVGIAAWRWQDYLGREARLRGIRLTVSPLTRHQVNPGLNQGKISGQYVNSILAKTQAARDGFDEAILLDADRYVAEGTAENLLLVQDDTIFTSPGTHILAGITRDTLLTLARDAGHQVVEERIAVDRLFAADEVFVCGTAAEVVGVREIDRQPIGNGRTGPLTQQLQQLYHKTVRGQNRYARHWLDYMILNPTI